MHNFEPYYADLVREILTNGEDRISRNGKTRGIFCPVLRFDAGGDIPPLLVGRKMFYTGIVGEWAALIRGPKSVEDFEKHGCNYWKLWADKDGKLDVDYGNAWLDYNGVNQLQELVDKLHYNPTDRRLLVTGWRPDRLKDLSLPCCHHTYQFYVSDNNTLDMHWMQRSTDVMIGLPSDIMLAWLFLRTLAIETGFRPGEIVMSLGDAHIYEEHLEGAGKYLEQLSDRTLSFIQPDVAKAEFEKTTSFFHFTPHDLKISRYNPAPAIKFLLKE